MRRRLTIALLWAGVALVAVRFALPTLIERYIEGVLERNGAYTGSVGDVDLALWRGGGAIHDLEIVRRGVDVPAPFVSIPEASGAIRWKALLLHGEIVLRAAVDGPELHYVRERQDGSGGRWQETVEALTPIRIDRLVVRDGRLHYHDVESDPPVEVYLGDLELTAENLTNVRDADVALPARARLRATPMTAGRLDVRADLDPLARAPAFDADVELTDMQLAPWNSLLRAYAGVDVEAGTIALFAELEARDGHFDGYLKPLVQGLDVLRVEEEAEEQGALASAWEAVVGATAEVFQNQPTERLATRIPVTGTVEKPETEFWPAFANVLRNAFVEAFAPRLDADDPR